MYYTPKLPMQYRTRFAVMPASLPTANNQVDIRCRECDQMLHRNVEVAVLTTTLDAHNTASQRSHEDYLFGLRRSAESLA
jgi:hypothetical protein